MKRRVLVPHTDGKHRVIGGCKLPLHQQHGLRLRDFMKATAVPPVPATCDWSAAADAVIADIEGNDTRGDCVEAEDAHYIGVVTGNSGNGLFAYSDAQTIADYSAITGYSPNDPSTDQGTDPIVDLNYRVSHGYADGSRDVGWAYVDATNPAEVQYAVAVFGNLKSWFGIPDSIVNNMPNTSGFIWDVSAGAPNSQNGHCIGACGFNPTVIPTAKGLYVMTWGLKGLITWEAVAAWFVSVAGGGFAVRITQDWIDKTSGVSPSGLNLPGLIAGCNAVFGGSIAVPTPAPSPAPPGPLAPVSLAEAQGWSTAGLNEAHVFLTRGQAIDAANAGLAAGWPKS